MQNNGSILQRRLLFKFSAIAIISLLAFIFNFQFCSAIGLDSFATATGQLKEPFTGDFSHNNITGWNPFECETPSNGVNATGDWAKIMQAKNADGDVFNVDPNSEWGANWSDTDSGRIKHVLETYGDLAYQTGQVIGAPWTAIFVQMRYEDGGSVCGRNNFWGNGCPPGTGAGGASLQGQNLGEGFIQYGQTVEKICGNASNVGNEEECRESLKVSDPKVYLQRLGPLWVQGDANGGGYGSYDGEVQSLNALQAFLDTAEGQAIVQSFGNYSGEGGGSSEPVTGDQITWIGDSYSTGARSIIEEKFPGISFGGSVNDANSYIQGCKNVASDTDCNANPTNPSGLNVLKRIIDKGEIKPYLVMAVGTNEGWSDSSIATLDKLMAGAPDTKVVLVTSKTANSDYADSNGRLKTLANTNDNYRLADWAAVADSSYFAEDPIHPTSNGGYEKWVSVISDALNSASSDGSDPFCPCANGTTQKYTSTEWEGGWIKSGTFDGYVKEPAEGSGYDLPEEAVSGGHTQNYSTDGKPNKILLHSTEGGSGSGNSGLALYGNVTKGGTTGITPAHFTINLQDKKVFQHFSIDKPSDAIIEDLDAGIQIEIIGFMGSGSPSLNSFSDEEWNYLAQLLLAISDQTGIKLDSSADWTHTNRYSESDFRNYTGVLGHMHAPSNQNHDDPGDIWSKVSDAIGRMKGKGGICGGGGDFASYVLKYAWPEYRDEDVNKDEYQTDQVRRSGEGIYTGSNGFTHTDQLGVDCGGFVTAITQESKMDPNYNSSQCNTICQIAYAKEHYERVTDTSQLQPGDIAFSDDSDSPGHTWIYVGEVEGFGSNIASASWGTRSPCAGQEGTGGAWYHNPNPGGS